MSPAPHLNRILVGSAQTSVPAAPPAPFNAKSVLFDGVDDHVLVGDIAALEPALADTFSLTLWVKRLATANVMFISKCSTGGTGLAGFYFGIIGGALDFYIGNIGSYLETQATGISVPGVDGLWHMYGVTHNGSGTYTGVKFYLDGVQYNAANVAAGTGSTANTADYRMQGYMGSGYYANASQDEIGHWNKVLTAAEMTEVYNGGTPASLLTHSASANLVEGWRMGEGDTAPTILGIKGLYPGTLTNGATITTDHA